MQAFHSIEDAKAFALAGNAILTLQSLRSNNHFTYRVRLATDKETGEPQPGRYKSNTGGRPQRPPVPQ